MSEWFQAKVKFAKQLDNGLIKQSTELYLIDAVCFADAETRAFKEQGEGMREIQAVAMSRSPIKEVVFYGDTDQWFKVKVTWSDIDEVTEKEKKFTTYFLVNAADVKEAYARTEEHLKEMLVPFKIPKVEESPIIDVYQYEKAASKGFAKVEKSDTTYHGSEIESEEECAMESESVEAIDITKITDAQLGIFEANARAIINRERPIGMDVAIDPTDGQAVAFEMPLRAYLMEIRPYDWVTLTTEIEKVWNDNPKGTRWVLGINGLTDDQKDHVMDILLTNQSFEADEEYNDTDLESRFDAAMNRS